MSSEEANIYDDPRFRDLDVGDIMRIGHPDISEGDVHIVDTTRDLRESLSRPLRIMDIGSGSGHLSMLLARALSDCEIIANDIAIGPVSQAEEKLAGFPNARVFDQPFEKWTETLDVAISWGTHHHMHHSYIEHVDRLLSPDGIFIIGDELCPEYLQSSDMERVNSATMVTIEDGYIFDNEADLYAYRKTGTVPQWSARLEGARRRALWEWYKFVGDYAAECGVWSVLISELRIAADDLVTSFAGEHKTSAFLLERELTLAGFSVIGKAVIGDRDPALQSFTVYACRSKSPDGGA